MKKYRLTALVLVAGICAASFSGCKPTDDAPVSSAAVSSPTAASASHIKQTFPNGLTIDADVSIPKGINTKAVKIQKVEAVPFSSEKVSRTLLQGHEIKAHKSRSQGATRGGIKRRLTYILLRIIAFSILTRQWGRFFFQRLWQNRFPMLILTTLQPLLQQEKATGRNLIKRACLS